MGLTHSSTGRKAAGSPETVIMPQEGYSTVALAGNPNVGKSTVFNSLTGLNQHTGNWPGKTVLNAQGVCKSDKRAYVMVDIPGTYSLMAHSAEEEVAWDFICFGGADAVVVVCDATCLERNLNLVLQTMEASRRVLVCVNLLDEARRKNISVDIPALSRRLGVPVLGMVARERGSREALLTALDSLLDTPAPGPRFCVSNPEGVEQAVDSLLPMSQELCGERLDARWLSLRLLEGDTALLDKADAYLDGALSGNKILLDKAERERQKLRDTGVDRDRLEDMLASVLVTAAEDIGAAAVRCDSGGSRRDRHIDRLVTGRLLGYPLMLLLLALIFYITIVGANYPSELLSKLLLGFQTRLWALFTTLGAPKWLGGLLIDGAYRVLAWVVLVM